ncbi:MAG: PQQ-dependent sugar dehydrogenase [Alphaproteobacteria bacterium]|nr:PQQ-dependent sugar dehydrogenase [Alphaproteobacteria bacterium]
MRLFTPLLVAALAVGCATPDGDGALGVAGAWSPDDPAFDSALPLADGQLAPPTQTLDLEVSELRRGQSTTWTVSNLAASETVYVAYSLDGIQPGACLGFAGGLCLDIGGPRLLLGTAVADGAGVATVTRTVPSSIATGTEVAFQAVAVRGANSTSSNPVLSVVVNIGPGITNRPSNPDCVAGDRPPSTASTQLQRKFNTVSGLNVPTALLLDPSSHAFWYVAEQGGTIKRFANTATPTASSVLTIPGVSSGGELGLLAMAFDPQWPARPYLYVYYTTNSGGTLRSRISRWTTFNNGASWNSELTLLEVAQPFSNHNGGNLGFGQDGYLYFGFGDGGSANDPGNRAQNVNNLLGKFIRIDVSSAASGSPYTIPADNPFASGGGSPEIYALGVRNPYRWSFDRATGQLWAGDVGQDAREEIDIIELGRNYGWKVMEGTNCANTVSGLPCNSPLFTPPVWEYAHSGFSSRSVIGGYVYRGSAIPALVGKYLYADFYTGQISALSQNSLTGAYTSSVLLTQSGIQISTFAEDEAGEVYVMDYAGSIYEVVPGGGSTGTPVPGMLSGWDCFTAPGVPATGVIPYEPTSKLWSDGLEKHRWLAIPDGTTIDIDADGDFLFPIGTVLAKEFLHNGDRVETRLFVRHTDGDWGAYDYKWLPDGSDAALITSGQDITLPGGQSWHLPSQAECMTCHTAAANRSLGLELAQLNVPGAYGNLWANQVRTLDHIGMFTTSPGPVTGLDVLSRLDGGDSAEDRARSYLHSNCSMCHRPGGTGLGGMDFRYFTAFADMNLCNETVTGSTGGFTGTTRFTPGDAAHSIVYLRPASTDPAFRMPPLGTSVPDDDALMAIEDWITDTTVCP